MPDGPLPAGACGIATATFAAGRLGPGIPRARAWRARIRNRSSAGDRHSRNTSLEGSARAFTSGSSAAITRRNGTGVGGSEVTLQIFALSGLHDDSRRASRRRARSGTAAGLPRWTVRPSAVFRPCNRCRRNGGLVVRRLRQGCVGACKRFPRQLDEEIDLIACGPRCHEAKDEPVPPRGARAGCGPRQPRRGAAAAKRFAEAGDRSRRGGLDRRSMLPRCQRAAVRRRAGLRRCGRRNPAVAPVAGRA